MKKILIAIFIISMIMLSGCLFMDEELNAAVKTGNTKNCDKLTNQDGSVDQDRIDNCYSKIAVNQEDTAICDQIENKDYSGPCYGDIAIATEDEELCAKAGHEADDCYGKIAIAKNDEDICKQITSDGYTKSNCFEKIAIEKVDQFICEQLEHEDDQDKCLSNYAIAVGDTWICKKLKTEKEKNVCLMGVAQTEEDANICDEITDKTGNYYHKCVAEVAEKTGDHSVCEKLEEPQAKTIPDEIDECYYMVGYYQNKASACSAVKDEGKRTKCLLRVAEQNADTDICDERLTKSEDKDECYMKIAFSQDHKRYCDEISDATVKANCLQNFE
jgi:hypothetical protein